MTIDEAIAHCLEVAEQNETQAEKIGRQIIGSAIDKYTTDCRECAADHRQLAEWLKELKQWRRVYGVCPSYEMCIPECKEGYNAQIAEYKRLLKAAVEVINREISSFTTCEECNMYDEETTECNGNAMDKCSEIGKWRYADKALALIGEDGDTNG